MRRAKAMLISLLIGGYFTPFSLQGEDQKIDYAQSMIEIDREIERLKKELRAYRGEADEDVLESQPYMLANWPKFSRELEEARQNREAARQIQKRIKQLEQHKNNLESELNSRS